MMKDSLTLSTDAPVEDPHPNHVRYSAGKRCVSKHPKRRVVYDKLVRRQIRAKLLTNTWWTAALRESKLRQLESDRRLHDGPLVLDSDEERG